MASSQSLQHLGRELQEIFGARLKSFVVYGPRDEGAHHSHQHHGHDHPLTHTLAIVDDLTAADLRACAGRVSTWHDAGLATPLVLGTNELERALDVFPFEFGAILADHAVLAGGDPFVGLQVDPADLRWSCEVHARGHLLHLRESFIETRGRSDALAVLIVRSAAPFAALLANVARLDNAAAPDHAAAARHVERVLNLAGPASEIVGLVGVKEITSAEAERLFPPYLETVQRLVGYIDRWNAR
jgi:hypothetical protein